MRSGPLGSVLLVLLGTGIASAQSTNNTQAAAPVAPTTQPAKVTAPHAGRQVFKANSGGKPTKPGDPGMATPTPTVTLKPGEIPKIQFDTPIYDFGRVRAGTDIQHDYWFTNTGNGPLEILAVKPG